MRTSFVRQAQPFIVGVIREQHPDHAIATIKTAEYDGAQAFTLHLSRMDRQYHTYEDLKRIMSSTTLPVLVLNYRNNGWIPDDERIQTQLLALEAGAAAMDMPADTFDPDPARWDVGLSWQPSDAGMKPMELSVRPEVVEKQIKLIEQVQAAGAEVLLSSHTRVVMSCEQVVEHARMMSARGADAVKIVSACTNEDELIEGFKATVALKRALQQPFQYQCHGEHGKLLRVMGPMLGSMMVFCNQRYAPNTLYDQPLIHAMRRVFQNVSWKVSRPVKVEDFNQA